MKAMLKSLSVAAAMAGAASVPVVSHADVSYNVGFVSEYLSD